jgi:hypothetical protein
MHTSRVPKLVPIDGVTGCGPHTPSLSDKKCDNQCAKSSGNLLMVCLRNGHHFLITVERNPFDSALPPEAFEFYSVQVIQDSAGTNATN